MTRKTLSPGLNFNLNKSHINCSNCSLYLVCEPTTVGDAVFDLSEKLLLKKQPFKTGDIIYQEGRPFRSLFALTTGSAKEVCLAGDEERILGFKLKGELTGQDAIATGVYPHTLVALEDSTLCILPYDKLTKSADSLPSLSTQIIKLFAAESYHDSQIRRSLATAKSAENKVRAFIYNIATRFKARNLAYTEIKLSMSRKEIADYLGITKETLSRSLTSLQNKALIEISGKNIHIVDYETLNH